MATRNCFFNWLREFNSRHEQEIFSLPGAAARRTTASSKEESIFFQVAMGRKFPLSLVPLLARRMLRK
jgi:hypothetical protein